VCLCLCLCVRDVKFDMVRCVTMNLMAFGLA